ncbi:chromate resistance protein ChrB domain-containing protein [Burkholderia sp. F1]|uniref:chromate resistance protein ChrB domain-containing protein n=1 Tax=Burkholderia sp. F1 TaxID=3366817 RepID=UPI003D72F8F6
MTYRMKAVPRIRTGPCDVPDVELGRHDGRCSFDALLDKYRLHASALPRLAGIVRGADTGRLGLAPEASGLHAIPVGLSRNFTDGHEQRRHGIVVVDARHARRRRDARA